MGAVAIQHPGSTEPAQLDAQVRRLKDAAPGYARLPLSERRALLRDMRYRTADLASEWVRVACQAKGLDMQSPLSGEEWLAGPFVTTRAFRLLDVALEEVARFGQPRIDDDWIRDRENGGLAVQASHPERRRGRFDRGPGIQLRAGGGRKEGREGTEESDRGGSRVPDRADD